MPMSTNGFVVNIWVSVLRRVSTGGDLSRTLDAMPVVLRPSLLSAKLADNSAVFNPPKRIELVWNDLC